MTSLVRLLREAPTGRSTCPFVSDRSCCDDNAPLSDAFRVRIPPFVRIPPCFAPFWESAPQAKFFGGFLMRGDPRFWSKLVRLPWNAHFWSSKMIIDGILSRTSFFSSMSAFDNPSIKNAHFCLFRSSQNRSQTQDRPNLTPMGAQLGACMAQDGPKMTISPFLVHPPCILHSRAPFWTHPPHILRPGVQNTQRACQK